VIQILTGPVHSGKTTLLQRLADQLKKQNIEVAGFLSLYTEEKDQFIGYDLFDLIQGTRTPFIRKEGQKAWQRIGPYFFIPESLDHAQNIILRSTKADICVIDEVGPLELEGKGLGPALKKVMPLLRPEYILVIRDSILDKWLRALGEIPTKIFRISDNELLSKMVKYFNSKSRDKGNVEPL
jgi:nucleoside-triphosphatase THEP1